MFFFGKEVDLDNRPCSAVVVDNVGGSRPGVAVGVDEVLGRGGENDGGGCMDGEAGKVGFHVELVVGYARWRKLLFGVGMERHWIVNQCGAEPEGGQIRSYKYQPIWSDVS